MLLLFLKPMLMPDMLLKELPLLMLTSLVEPTPTLDLLLPKKLL